MCMYIYIYMERERYTYIYIYMYTCIYIYIERERDTHVYIIMFRAPPRSGSSTPRGCCRTSIDMSTIVYEMCYNNISINIMLMIL